MITIKIVNCVMCGIVSGLYLEMGKKGIAALWTLGGALNAMTILTMNG